MTDTLFPQPTASRNGKRRELTVYERALGKRLSDDGEGTNEGDRVQIDFGGITLVGKAIKVSRLNGCQRVRLTLEFSEAVSAEHAVATGESEDEHG